MFQDNSLNSEFACDKNGKKLQIDSVIQQIKYSLVEMKITASSFYRSWSLAVAAHCVNHYANINCIEFQPLSITASKVGS